MKRLLSKTLLSGLLIACLGFGGRPFGTDDAATVSAGSYELEFGYDMWGETGSIGLGFKHGLTEKMDIGIGFGYNLITEPKRCFSSSELSLKYNFIPDMLAASFSTGFNGSEYCINGIFTRCFGPLEIDANFGYATGDSSITYAGALIYSTGNFAFGGEVLGDEETQNWLAGFRYTIKDGLMVDAGFTSDFTIEEKTATVGLHYEF